MLLLASTAHLGYECMAKLQPPAAGFSVPSTAVSIVKRMVDQRMTTATYVVVDLYHSTTWQHHNVATLFTTGSVKQDEISLVHFI